jgi:hypothetical protein
MRGLCGLGRDAEKDRDQLAAKNVVDDKIHALPPFDTNIYICSSTKYR